VDCENGNAALNFKVGGTLDSNNLLGFDATVDWVGGRISVTSRAITE